MFCPACQQDVPALAVPEEPGVVRCTFCGEGLTAEAKVQGRRSKVEITKLSQSPSSVQVAASSARTSDPAATEGHQPRVAIRPRPDFEDWDLEPDIRSAQRLMASLKQSAPEKILAPSPAAIPAPERITPKEPLAPAERSGTLAWACLSLGVMTLACGGVLIGWSLAADRADLWSLGLPLAVVGQAGLVIGLLLQLDGLWQSSKKTEQTLTQLDGKLYELKHATTLLGTSHSTPAQSFYVHMAEGASPHLLLADLKGQLDLLAEQLARK